MKLRPIKSTAELTTKDGVKIAIRERLTIREHLQNARKLKASKITIEGIEHFINA